MKCSYRKLLNNLISLDIIDTKCNERNFSVIIFQEIGFEI